jgi:signal transduction histidine kinase
VLQHFVVSNRELIIARATSRVATRTSPKPSEAEIKNGIPVFVDQLAAALGRAESGEATRNEEMTTTAGLHGADLFRIGLTIGQVVRDYGDVCQVITELAVEQGSAITVTDFQTLNLCLDDAIGGAVTEYARQTESEGTERLGVLAHELRNLLNAAMLAFEMIKSGRVAPGGSTGSVLGRSLIGLRNLVDRSLADVRLEAGIEHLEPIGVAEFVADIEIAASLQAAERGVHLTITSVDPTVTIHGDRQVLAAAISNLLQNGFKFTPRDGHVSLTTRATANRVLFEVEDECGGLPPGRAADLFRPYEQQGDDRSGLGLGLAICLKAAHANGGEIHVRDLPGKGCIFTLELPRQAPPPLSVVEGGKGKVGTSEARGAKPTATARKPSAVAR